MNKQKEYESVDVEGLANELALSDWHKLAKEKGYEVDGVVFRSDNGLVNDELANIFFGLRFQYMALIEEFKEANELPIEVIIKAVNSTGVDYVIAGKEYHRING